MEAEYTDLSTSLKQLIPFKCLVECVWEAVSLKKDNLISINTTVWEDNQGCKIFATRMTPGSKHYAIKYHWFCTQLESNNIVIKIIDSVEQLADMFTKGLRRVLFEACRLKLMGW